MPVAPNPLLQANAIAKTSRSATVQADKPLQALGDNCDAFGQVMAKQGRDKVTGQDDKVAQAKPKDKPDAAAGGKKDPAGKAAVADDGNKLPEEDSAQADTGVRDASLVAGQVTDAQPGAQLIQAQAEAVAPVLQAATAQTQVAAALPEEPSAEEAFDPDADPWPTCQPCASRWSTVPRPRVAPRHMPSMLPRLRARKGRRPSIPWRIWSRIPMAKAPNPVTRPLAACLRTA